MRAGSAIFMGSMVTEFDLEFSFLHPALRPRRPLRRQGNSGNQVFPFSARTRSSVGLERQTTDLKVTGSSPVGSAISKDRVELLKLDKEPVAVLGLDSDPRVLDIDPESIVPLRLHPHLDPPLVGRELERVREMVTPSRGPGRQTRGKARRTPSRLT